MRQRESVDGGVGVAACVGRGVGVSVVTVVGVCVGDGVDCLIGVAVLRGVGRGVELAVSTRIGGRLGKTLSVGTAKVVATRGGCRSVARETIAVITIAFIIENATAALSNFIAG